MFGKECQGALQSQLGVASIRLVGSDGRVVGATNRNLLGTNYRDQSFFIDAQRSSDTVFSSSARAGGGFEFTYSKGIMSDGKSIGVIVVAVDLMKYERAWAGLQDVVMVTSQVILCALLGGIITQQSIKTD